MTAIPVQVRSGAPVRRLGVGSALVGLTTVLLLAFPLVVTAAVVPKFEEIFKDFGVALPELTRVYVQLGRALSSPLGWAMTIAAILLIAVPMTALASRRAVWAGILLAIAALIGLLYLVVLGAAMYTPLVAMIQSLQQSGGRP